MSTIVEYTLEQGVATITMDDGKNNVVSPRLVEELNAALDRAESDNALIILTGREGVFSAGFDLKTLRSGGAAAFGMIIGGFQLSKRLLSFPRPVIIACNGHAIAMGSFLVLSGDYRIATEGDFRVVANEVAIGLTMPHSAVEICRQRLTPAAFVKAVLLSEGFTPLTAVDAGFVDTVVTADELQESAKSKAKALAELDIVAHRNTKRRIRGNLVRAMGKAINRDRLEFAKMGLKAMVGKK